MKIFEAKMSYNLVRDGDDQCCDHPKKIVSYLDGAFDQNPMQETFGVILLSRKNKAICRHNLTVGNVSSVTVDVPAIFRSAILSGASGIAIFHNHPSGDPYPSMPDIQMTRKVREAGNLLGIPLVDHVIIGDKDSDPNGQGYYSFKEAGLC